MRVGARAGMSMVVVWIMMMRVRRGLLVVLNVFGSDVGEVVFCYAGGRGGGVTFWGAAEWRETSKRGDSGNPRHA